MRLSLAWLAVLAVGCANRAPVMQPIDDQTGSVGAELTFELRATDPDGDSLTFDFEAPMIPDLKSRSNPARVSSFTDGVAIFRWTPGAQDRNSSAYAFDFKVSDGKATTTETVQITILDSAGGGAPIFREPLGTGTTLDLDQNNCIEVAILVDDPDSTAVTISEEEPLIEGATLEQTGNFEATWQWCPTPEQIE